MGFIIIFAVIFSVVIFLLRKHLEIEAFLLTMILTFVVGAAVGAALYFAGGILLSERLPRYETAEEYELLADEAGNYCYPNAHSYLICKYKTEEGKFTTTPIYSTERIHVGDYEPVIKITAKSFKHKWMNWFFFNTEGERFEIFIPKSSISTTEE